MHFSTKKELKGTSKVSEARFEEKLVELSNELDAEKKYRKKTPKQIKAEVGDANEKVPLLDSDLADLEPEERDNAGLHRVPSPNDDGDEESGEEAGAEDADFSDVIPQANTSANATTPSCSWRLTKLKFWPVGQGKAAVNFFQTLCRIVSPGL